MMVVIVNNMWWLLILLVDCYVLHNYTHKSNVLPLNVGPCPFAHCDLLVLDAINAFRFENEVFQIQPSFLTMYEHPVGQLTFVPQSSHSFTVFILGERNTVLKYNVYIGTHLLSSDQIYNVILHELMHVFLVDHGEYSDSISGHVVQVGGQQSRLRVTQDDYKGLVESGLRYHGLTLRHKDVIRQIARIKLPFFVDNVIKSETTLTPDSFFYLHTV